MAVNTRTVQHRDDGQWEVRAPGASRASAVTSTQAAGIDRAREILSGSGGGELTNPRPRRRPSGAGHPQARQRPTLLEGLIRHGRR
jgi:hypothetical protein